jgi:hypothetical protein
MSDDLLTNLKASSKRWATAVTVDATRNLGKYASLIRVKSQTIEEAGKLTIVSTGISTNKLKPVARAYEFGSGIRSRSSKTSPHQQGSRGFVRIAPKTKKVLAFFWDKVDSNTPGGKKFVGVSSTTGKAMFNYVDHPGVEATNSGKGYLAPAITKVRNQIKKEVPKDVRDAVLGSFRRAFKK